MIVGRNHAVSMAIAAALVAVVAPRAVVADTLAGGFNGDLSSPIGGMWELSADPAFNWGGEFVDPLSEGSNALRITHNSNWQAGFALKGAPEALAQIIATHDALQIDVAPNPAMSWRQIFAIANADNGWNQSPELGLAVPSEVTPFNRIVIDLTDVRGDNTADPPDTNPDDDNWKLKAQQWLAATDPLDREYFELFIGFQGQDLPGSELTTADYDLDGDVDATDLGFWRDSFGVDGGGDTDLDGDTDGEDFLAWQAQFTGVPRPYSIIDNVVFVGPAASTSSVPEPATLGMTAIVILSCCITARRMR